MHNFMVILYYMVHFVNINWMCQFHTTQAILYGLLLKLYSLPMPNTWPSYYYTASIVYTLTKYQNWLFIFYSDITPLKTDL